ncbi:hypothetical protein D3C72_1964570 [compost metagenome]
MDRDSILHIGCNLSGMDSLTDFTLKQKRQPSSCLFFILKPQTLLIFLSNESIHDVGISGHGDFISVSHQFFGIDPVLPFGSRIAGDSEVAARSPTVAQ